MIYECPNCHIPQAAGRTSCHHCGAEFDGPVPADALVPETVAAAEAAPAASSPAGTMPEPPRLQDVRPTPQESRPPEPPAYPPPAYSPPSGYVQTAPAPTPAASGFNLPKALLIAIPVVLVLVLGAIFFANSLNQGGEASAPPPPMMSPMTEPAGPAQTTHGSPLVLPASPGSAGNTGSAPNTTWLIGRWQNKSTDFYVFNENGTGNRGSISGKQPTGSFSWILAQKQIVLYTDAGKPEKLAFSQGSDDNTMYLRITDGHYVQYTRTDANT